MVSIFEICISRNIKCGNSVGFPKSGHNYVCAPLHTFTWMYTYVSLIDGCMVMSVLLYVQLKSNQNSLCVHTWPYRICILWIWLSIEWLHMDGGNVYISIILYHLQVVFLSVPLIEYNCCNCQQYKCYFIHVPHTKEWCMTGFYHSIVY